MPPPNKLQEGTRDAYQNYFLTQTARGHIPTRPLEAGQAAHRPLHNRPSHAPSPRFEAQSPSTALHHATSGRRHTPVRGNPTGTAGRTPTTPARGPALTMRPTLFRGETVYRANTHVQRSNQQRPMTHATHRQEAQSGRLPHNPQQRVQVLLERAQQHINAGNIDRRLGANQRAYEEYQQAQRLAGQAMETVRRHHLGGEWLLTAGGVGRNASESTRQLLASGYAPIF